MGWKGLGGPPWVACRLESILPGTPRGGPISTGVPNGGGPWGGPQGGSPGGPGDPPDGLSRDSPSHPGGGAPRGFGPHPISFRLECRQIVNDTSCVVSGLGFDDGGIGSFWARALVEACAGVPTGVGTRRLAQGISLGSCPEDSPGGLPRRPPLEDSLGGSPGGSP